MSIITINSQLESQITNDLKQLFILPKENEHFTVLDWQGIDKDFMDVTFPQSQRLMYRAVMDDALHYAYKHNDPSTIKLYKARSSAESKISRDSFSIGIIDEKITASLHNRIKDVSLFNMPNFEDEVEKILKEEENKKLMLQQRFADQIDFNNVNSEEKAKKKAESPEEIERKRKKNFYKKLKERKRAWKEQQKELTYNLRIYRNDYVTLQKTTNALKPGGILIFITPLNLLDSEVSYKLANYYEDLHIYRNELLDRKEKVIVVGVKAKKRIRNNKRLAEIIEEARCTRLQRFMDRPQDSYTEEQLKQISINDPLTYNKIMDERLKNETYFYLSSESMPFYKIPTGYEEDIHLFRVGPVTTEELSEALKASKLNDKISEQIDRSLHNVCSTTPTPLHEGHLVMLLTSGILNGYVGKGINQHLVKGTAIKEVQYLEDTDDEGNTVDIEREYYNISVKTLNSNGEFKEIM